MNESTKRNSTTDEAGMKEPSNPTTNDNQRGMSLTEVLIALATLSSPVCPTILIDGTAGAHGQMEGSSVVIGHRSVMGSRTTVSR